MSSWKLEFFEERRESPITFWVHKGVDEEKNSYHECVEFNPPMPLKDPVKGYPFLTVTALGFDMTFSSLHEVEHFIAVMEQKNLPTTLSLSVQRGADNGPNSHWLSRFPAKYKGWTKRVKLVSAVKKAKESVVLSDERF